MRPGEKLYEELLIGKNVVQSQHPQIMQANEDFLIWNELQEVVNSIYRAHEQLDAESICQVLLNNVEGYHPS